MGTHTPNRHGKGTPDGGRFAPDEKPASPADTRALTLDPPGDVLVDSVADLYDKMTYDADGYDGHGYSREGFNRDGMHRNGTLYDDDSYNQRGFDTDGWHRNNDDYDDGGYDCDGFDEDGFNVNGVHNSGTDYDENGFDKDRDHYNGTRYNDDGWDWNGEHRNGTFPRRRRLRRERFRHRREPPRELATRFGETRTTRPPLSTTVRHLCSPTCRCGSGSPRLHRRTDRVQSRRGAVLTARRHGRWFVHCLCGSGGDTSREPLAVAVSLLIPRRTLPGTAPFP